MVITLSHVEFAKSDQADIWSVGNEILYRFCREHPSHQQKGVVVAKIWLIGRSYGAAVERGKKNDEKSLYEVSTFYEQVALAIIKSELDERIDTLRQYNAERIEALRQYNAIDKAIIIQILRLHQCLVTVLERLTKDKKRSLASKYLHFHLPDLFFIYDSVSARSLTKIKPRQRARRKVSGDFDDEYKTFFLKLLDLQEEIQKEFGEVLTPRQIDRILWNLSGQWKPD